MTPRWRAVGSTEKKRTSCCSSVHLVRCTAKSYMHFQLVRFFYCLLSTLKNRYPESLEHSKLQNYIKESYRLKRRCRLCCRALGSYENCPFYRVLLSRCIESMSTCTGFDYNGFHSLLRIFYPVFYKCSPYSENDGRLRHHRVGRQRLTNAEICLGLVLVWTRTQGSLYAIATDFWLIL